MNVASDNINEVTVSDILKITHPGYMNDAITLFETIENSPIRPYPVRADMAMLVICTDGWGEIEINLRTFRLEKDNLLIVLPHQAVQIKEIDSIRFFAIAVSVKFMESVPNLRDKLLGRLLEVWEHPVVQLTGEERDSLKDFYDFFYKKMSRDGGFYKNDIARGIAYSLLFELGNIMHRLYVPSINKAARKDEILKRFLSLLSDNYNVSRSIDFYADKLCITSKHLSNVIKSATGRTPGQWISAYVILEAKMLLKNTDMSAAQISEQLGFSNPSHFGKYFKQNVGITPLEYKNS